MCSVKFAAAAGPHTDGVLAGSERQKEADTSGHRLQEARKINGSLSSLGRVIKALTEQGPDGGATHIPYRDSKLTHLLKVAARSEVTDREHEVRPSRRQTASAQAVRSRGDHPWAPSRHVCIRAAV